MPCERFSSLLIILDTISLAPWDVWWKSCATITFPSNFSFSPNFHFACSFLLISSRSHSLWALPHRWPASCSSSSHLYQTLTLSRVGSQLITVITTEWLSFVNNWLWEVRISPVITLVSLHTIFAQLLSNASVSVKTLVIISYAVN